MREFDMPPENDWERRVKRNLIKLNKKNRIEKLHRTPEQMRKDIRDIQMTQLIMAIALVIMAIAIGGMYKGWW